MAAEEMSDDDAMAAEWAAALAESKPEPVGGMSGAVQTETVAPANFTNFASTEGISGAGNDLNMILDIPVQLTVELGRTTNSNRPATIQARAKRTPGSVRWRRA